jgi:N-acetyl-gamma-glutamyl-phosphate reductase
VVTASSRAYADKPITDAFPNLHSYANLRFVGTETAEAGKGCDFAFLATPAGVAMALAGDLVADGVKVIDLGSDFRFGDPAVYEQWYGAKHTALELAREAVYGLPEIHAQVIAGARVIGNPGCYPTASTLALAPLLRGGYISASGIVIDAKSGVSGAGRHPGLDYHFPECAGSLRAYKVAAHRHTPEIEQEVSALAGEDVRLVFTPHLIPMTRGILVTAYAHLAKEADSRDLLGVYREFYEGKPFVRVLAEGELPQTKSVQGSNRCDVAVRVDQRTGTVIALAVIDNLVKGAAGQAIQNMNLMAGLPEETGLPVNGLWP